MSGACLTVTKKMLPAKKMFAYSVLYLFAIFSGLLADHFAPALKAVISGVF